MALTIQNKRTSHFRDSWPYFALLASLLVALALVASSYLQSPIVSTNLRVSEGEPVEIKQLQLNPEPIGALRIDVKAIIPNNRWVTYEIQLRDAQNNVLASALKEAWRESGTWYEEGESGIWEEDDLWGGLDVRAGSNQQEVVSIMIDVLEYSDTAGREIDQPVDFQVEVQNGVVDARYLIAGLFGSASMAVLAFLAVPIIGTKVISKEVRDSDIGDRSILGGRDRLVKVAVDITADETSPRFLNINLFVKDGYGEQIYSQTKPVKLSFKKDDKGRIQKATGKLKAFFILEPRGSYGLYAEVTPDASVDKTQLTVRDGARTVGGIEVVQISNS